MPESPDERPPTVTVSLEPARPTLLALHQARGALTLLRNAQDGHPAMKDEITMIRASIRTVFALEE